MNGSPKYYVALGDSMSIDDYAGGPGRGAASLLFANDDARFPDWRGRDMSSKGVADRFAVLARDGATSSDVAGRQMAQLRLLGTPPAAVSISMGGNDLLAAFGDVERAQAAIEGLEANANIVLLELCQLLEHEGLVTWATVYDPSDGSLDTEALGLGLWPEAGELLSQLNAVIRRVAALHGVAVADVHQRFIGHGASVGDPAQVEAEPVDRSLWYCGAVEPNAWGASEIRAAFWEAFGNPVGGPSPRG